MVKIRESVHVSVLCYACYGTHPGEISALFNGAVSVSYSNRYSVTSTETRRVNKKKASHKNFKINNLNLSNFCGTSLFLKISVEPFFS